MQTTNKRSKEKWVRDRAKGAYEKASCCFICGATEPLDLHHYNSVTNLLEKWAKEKGYDISTDEKIVTVRDEFIEDHKIEMYQKVATLCKKHHQALHSIYGAKPALATADKQERWVKKQKEKYEAKTVVG